MYLTILQNLKELKCLILKKKDIDGFSDHTIGIGACLLAVSKRKIYLEKYFSTNKALSVSTEFAHSCSISLANLTKFRELADSISLISKQ